MGKLSSYPEIEELNDDCFIPVIDESGTPKLNKKISKANLQTQVGSGWTDGGEVGFADFQAGDEVDSNPNKKEFEFITLAAGKTIFQVILVNEENLEGTSLEEANIELLNDNDDFIGGNLLDDWMNGDDKPNFKQNQLAYQDKSGKIFTTGTVLKLRLTCDIPIDDLTAGTFRIFYKLETIPVDITS